MRLFLTFAVVEENVLRLKRTLSCAFRTYSQAYVAFFCFRRFGGPYAGGGRRACRSCYARLLAPVALCVTDAGALMNALVKAFPARQIGVCVFFCVRSVRLGLQTSEAVMCLPAHERGRGGSFLLEELGCGQHIGAVSEGNQYPNRAFDVNNPADYFSFSRSLFACVAPMRTSSRFSPVFRSSLSCSTLPGCFFLLMADPSCW